LNIIDSLFTFKQNIYKIVDNFYADETKLIETKFNEKILPVGCSGSFKKEMINYFGFNGNFGTIISINLTNILRLKNEIT